MSLKNLKKTCPLQINLVLLTPGMVTGHLYCGLITSLPLLSTSVSAFTELVTKQVKIISRSASLTISHGGVGTSVFKVTKCLPFFYALGGWLVF